MVEDVRTRERLETILARRTGYLYNDFGGREPSSCPIHAVACRWVPRMLDVPSGALAVRKLWSKSLEDLVAAVIERGKPFGFCGSEPELALRRPPAQPVAPDRRPPARPVAPGTPPRAGAGRQAARERRASFLVSVADRTRGPVECWSTARLPFEPTGSLRAMREELAAAVAPLTANSDEVLHAVYRSPSRELVDCENVLFYNVGTGRFRRATASGLRFERAYDACAPIPGSIELRADHYMSYSVTPRAGDTGSRAGCWPRGAGSPRPRCTSSPAWRRSGWECAGPDRPFAVRRSLDGRSGSGSESVAAVGRVGRATSPP